MIESAAGDFAALLDAVTAGDQDAAAVLFADIHPRLRRFLTAAEPRFADDLAGEVWEAIARGIGSFAGNQSDFRAWVFTIARRRVVEHRRRATRRRTEPAADTQFADLVALEAPERQVIEQMSTNEITALITASLSPDQAEVVLLRVLGDLDAGQVADIVGRTENWVRVTQHRALRKLADRVTSKLGVMR
jgi:RNA polymerase sigma-70 factor, ECF subfamily